MPTTARRDEELRAYRGARQRRTARTGDRVFRPRKKDRSHSEPADLRGRPLGSDRSRHGARTQMGVGQTVGGLVGHCSPQYYPRHPGGRAGEAHQRGAEYAGRGWHMGF